MSGDIWDQGYTVHLASFWGWSPEEWGTVSYSQAGRRETVVAKTTDPFIVAAYVTKNSPNAPAHEQGKIVGMYLVSHEKGHRDELTHPNQHQFDPEKWQHGLRALRAFKFLPEFRLSLRELDPVLTSVAHTLGSNGRELTSEQSERLTKISYIEEAVFGGSPVQDPSIHYRGPAQINPAGISATQNQGRVGAGAVNHSGYTVPPEPIDAPRELYILRLDGDVDTWLNEPSGGRSIFKIGQSMSPQTRCDTFQRALPHGRFAWHVDRSTRLEGDDPYPGFANAVAGEDAMKDYLAKNALWLGGEFYAATDNQMDTAWKLGRRVASDFAAESKA